MRRTTWFGWSAARARVAPAFALAVALAGCGSSGVGVGGVHIRDSQFIREADGGPTEAPWEAHRAVAPPLNTSMGFSPTLGEMGALDLQVEAGPPEPRPDAVASAAPVLIDAKVGEVNGVPIYASEFFADMATRLRADARTMSREQWEKALDERIRTRLAEVIRGVLIVAEARATLTPVQRANLAAFLRRTAQDLQSANYGSRSLADERLSDSTGLTFDQMVRQREEELLVQFGLDAVRNRVQVSDADVRREFRRQHERFNPPALAKFLLIRVPPSDAAGIAEVTSALEQGMSGGSFAAVAARLVNRAPSAGVHDVRFTGEWEDAVLFTDATINAAAKALKPGTWSGPHEDVGGWRVWLWLDSIDQRRVPYYEAQAVIRQELLTQRYQEEHWRFINKLKRGANEINEEEIIARLKQYAIEHFLPPPAR